jgi:hypothetical protein
MVIETTKLAVSLEGQPTEGRGQEENIGPILEGTL